MESIEHDERRQQLLYSVRRAAQELDLSVATIWRRIADGTLETVKVGGSTRITGESMRRVATPSEK